MSIDVFVEAALSGSPAASRDLVLTGDSGGSVCEGARAALSGHPLRARDRPWCGRAADRGVATAALCPAPDAQAQGVIPRPVRDN